MPPLPRLRIAAIEELARQLRYAPPETQRRQLLRAEQLAAEIDPAINYPEDWIVFRITGYRPETADASVIVGEALLGDISALVERLSAAAGIQLQELDQSRYVDADAVTARWSVSRKTLDRYRRQGLVARRVIGAKGKPRLMFDLAAVERFEKQQQARLGEAREFTRLSPELEARIVRRAGIYQRRLGCNLNQAAARLAKRYGRAHETIRQLLKRHDAASDQPLFQQQGPPSARERRLIDRASFMGIEPGVMARRLNRSSASIHRVINDQRAARLRTLSLPSRVEGSADILKAPAATDGLGTPAPCDLLELLQAIRATGAPAAPEERARAAAYQYLVGRAGRGIATLPAHGAKALEVDAIETDLRWAARLKAELVRSHLPLLIRTLESSLGRPTEEMRPAELLEVLRQGIAAIAQGVHEFQPVKGGRLAAPVGLAVTRVVTRYARAQPVGLSRTRAQPLVGRPIHIDDWTRRICPWQSFKGAVWLEPPASVRLGMGSLDERLRMVLMHRYGWGTRPRTQMELATLLGTALVKVGPLERKALRSAAGPGASGQAPPES